MLSQLVIYDERKGMALLNEILRSFCDFLLIMIVKVFVTKCLIWDASVIDLKDPWKKTSHITEDTNSITTPNETDQNIFIIEIE